MGIAQKIRHGAGNHVLFSRLGPFCRQPAMDPDDALIHVLKLILCEGWKLPANQQSDEVDRCATILLKRIRAGDSYESLVSYVLQLRNSLRLRTSERSLDTEIVDRIVALTRNVRQD